MHIIEKQKNSQLKIGEWTIIPLENCLLKDEQKIVVIPKVMDLLLYFSKRANQVLSIQELSEAIWPNEFVGDNAIYNLIGQLRKAFNDNAAKPIYIETLSKKGYRLIADVSQVPSFNISPNLPKNSNKTKLRITINKGLLVVGTVLIIAYLISLILPSSKSTTTNLSLAQQQYSLGQFHFNKGQADNIKKAVSYFQQSLTIEPNYIPVMLDLGFAYLQLSHSEDESHAAYKNKARELAKNMRGIAPNNINVLALAHLTLQGDEQKQSHQGWLRSHNNNSLSHRAFIAFSKVYFDTGKINEAIELQHKALSLCANCAYIYNALSNSLLIKGELEQAFANFQLYLELNDGQAKNPLREFGYSNLKLSKLKATLKWIETSGIEPDSIGPKQRNSLALFYLSTRQPQKAQKLMLPALNSTDNSFFTLYTLAALYGAQKDYQQSHAFFEKRMTLYPENKRFILSVAYSFWIAGKSEQALKLLQQMNLQSEAVTLLEQSTDIGLIQLYGALLIENGQQNKGRKVLTNLAKRFKQGLLGSSEQGFMAYAQTLAQLGENKSALKEIEITLENGWVEDFNSNWWYLEDDPFFNHLLKMEKFSELIKKHRKKISSLIE